VIDNDDLRRLDEWRHERISEADFAVLQQHLNENAELRAAMRALADIEEGLSALALKPLAIVPPAEPKRFVLHQWIPWTIAAAAVAFAVIGWLPRFEGAKPGSAPTVAVTALLVDEAGAEFAQKRQTGDVRFDPGSYELRAGTVHLRYANGADLVVQGPARFDIRDEFHTQLAYGRVRAIVPPTAHGFTVETRDVYYEDMGTEFGLSMDADTGESTMHVFDGQVNLHRSGKLGLLKSVFEGDAVRCRDGKVDPAPELDLEQFPSPGEIGYLRWNALRGKMLADPNLIAWFPFTRENNASILTNAQRVHGVPDGRIAGAQWAAGRWPGKQALLFDRDTDFAELEIPGEFQELTIGVWLMVDRIDWDMNAIMNSDGSDAGDIHFQMNRYGLPRGGVLGPEKVSCRWVGNPVALAKWVHVVSVMSLPKQQTLMYVNGERVWEVDMKSKVAAISPGCCRLGNWLQEGLKYGSSPRALRGRMDEVAIWNRALTQSEILSLTEKGRPSLLWSRENPPLRTPMPKP
jgi:hypothetical protein